MIESETDYLQVVTGDPEDISDPGAPERSPFALIAEALTELNMRLTSIEGRVNALEANDG